MQIAPKAALLMCGWPLFSGFRLIFHSCVVLLEYFITSTPMCVKVRLYARAGHKRMGMNVWARSMRYGCQVEIAPCCSSTVPIRYFLILLSKQIYLLLSFFRFILM